MVEIKATDPTNYPNYGDVQGPLFEVGENGQLNQIGGDDYVVNLKDMYIFQTLRLEDTLDSDFQYVILALNRKDTTDGSVYVFITDAGYDGAIAVKIKAGDTYALGETGYKVTYTAPTTIDGHHVGGSFYVTGSLIDTGSLIGGRYPQEMKIKYSLGNYDPDARATSVGEIMPSYERVPLIKYSGLPSNISQPEVYVVGFTGQEFNIANKINDYKKVFQGYYLTNPNVTSEGTISQFADGDYYLKTYYDDNGKVDFRGLYHQINAQGTMAVSVLNANNETLYGPQIISAGDSFTFPNYWTARNPYVTSSAHEVTLKYANLGSVIPVDENGNKIILVDENGKPVSYAKQYVNDPTDASRATSPYEKAPEIPGYVAVDPDKEIVLPDNLSDNTYIHYQINAEVTYNGKDSKPYDGQAGTINPDKLTWSKLPDGSSLNITGLKADDFMWVDKDGKEMAAPINAGTYNIKLAPKGEELLKDLNKGYNITKFDGTFTYKITPVDLTADGAVQYSGSHTKTYDGQVANVSDITNAQWTADGMVKGETFNYAGLTNADFTWKDATGKTLTAVPSGVGTYTLMVNETGLKKLETNNRNYQLGSQSLSGSYTYTITPASVEQVQYQGQDQKVYDGQAGTINPKKVTWSGLEGLNTSTLTASDFKWNTADGQAPVNVGQYTISLTSAGEKALRDANSNYDLKTISGTFTYKITPLTVVTVNHKGYDNKVYDGQPGVINLDKLVWDELPDGTNLNLDGLTSAYFSWDTPNHEAPTEVGRYTISLTKQGEKVLQAANPNYNFSKFTGTFVYEITPIANVTITYKGEDGKVYDGQPGTINPDKLIWSKLPDGTSLKMPKWSAGDFAWDTADGLAPTEVGTYNIILTDAGKSALQAANPDYELSNIDGVFTYEITPAQPSENPDQTPEQHPGQKPEQHPGQNPSQPGTPENGLGISTKPNTSAASATNANRLPQTGNDHSNTALAGLALASLTAMFGLGKKRKHD